MVTNSWNFTRDMYQRIMMARVELPQDVFNLGWVVSCMLKSLNKTDASKVLPIAKAGSQMKGCMHTLPLS